MRSKTKPTALRICGCLVIGTSAVILQHSSRIPVAVAEVSAPIALDQRPVLGRDAAEDRLSSRSPAEDGRRRTDAVRKGLPSTPLVAVSFPADKPNDSPAGDPRRR